MTTRSGASRRWAAVAGVAACAACCAGPLLTLLAGIGAVAAGAALWVPALAIVAVAAGLGAIVVKRRRHRPCRTPAGPVDLEILSAAIHKRENADRTCSEGRDP